MAYLAFADLGGAFAARALSSAPKADTVPVRAEQLTALEWSVVALARKDRLGSLRADGRLAATLRAVFRAPNPVLADPRLEALRRIAVLTWHYGYTVPSHEVSAVLAAGFTAGQYEAIVDSINATKLRSAGATRMAKLSQHLPPAPTVACALGATA